MNPRWKLAQKAEYAWWKNYLRPKAPHTYLANKKAYWHRFLTWADPGPLQDLHILDAGCGPAGLFMVLPGSRVTAIDPLLSRYTQGLASFFKPADYPWVRFDDTALERLEAEAMYDLVFCLNAINHVRDLELCLERLVAATKPGGRLFLSVDVHKTRALQHLFRHFPLDILHPHQLRADEYQDLMSNFPLVQLNCRLLKRGRIFDYCLMSWKKITK